MTPSSLLLSALAAAAHLGHVAHAQQQFGKDIYWNGPYVFLGCEPDQGAAMKALFKQIGISLENSIIPDAGLGTASPYGFKTWFSTNSGTIVSDIYQDINDGASDSSVNGRSVRKPSFVCVNYDNPLVQDASNACQSEKNYIALTGAKIDYVMLCPRFWDSDHGNYPSHSDCPQVNGAETAFTNGNSIGPGQLRINYNKQSTIIHELVHKYQPRPSGSNEVYGINQCMQLSAVDQLNNPNNYAFHSASKSPPASELGHPPPKTWQTEPALTSKQLSWPNALSSPEARAAFGDRVIAGRPPPPTAPMLST